MSDIKYNTRLMHNTLNLWMPPCFAVSAGQNQLADRRPHFPLTIVQTRNNVVTINETEQSQIQYL